MRVHLASMMLIATLGGGASAQQSATLSTRQASVARVSRRDAKRKAERLRRRLDFIPATSVGFAIKSSAKVIGSTLLTSGDFPNLAPRR